MKTTRYIPQLYHDIQHRHSGGKTPINSDYWADVDEGWDSVSRADRAARGAKMYRKQPVRVVRETVTRTVVRA